MFLESFGYFSESNFNNNFRDMSVTPRKKPHAVGVVGGGGGGQNIQVFVRLLFIYIATHK